MSDYSELNQLLNNLNGGSSYNSYNISTGDIAGAGIWLIIAAILSIVGGVLVYFLFVKSNTAPKGKFCKWLKDFLSFKTMWIEIILKIFYYIATIFIALYSFVFLGAFNTMGGAALLMFFLTLIVGPIIIRLIYEASIMFVMIWRNTKDIAENTKKK